MTLPRIPVSLRLVDQIVSVVKSTNKPFARAYQIILEVPQVVGQSVLSVPSVLKIKHVSTKNVLTLALERAV